MRILFFLFFVTFISCNKEVSPVTINADISNIDVEEVTLSGFDYNKKLPVKTSKVSDTLHISKAGIYTLSFGRNSSNIYLSPGDQVTINADATDFANTVKVESPHVAIQDYISQKNKLKKAFFGRSNFKLEPQEYIAQITKGKDSLTSLLSKLKVPISFAAFESKNLDYDNAKYRFIYPDYADKKVEDLSADFQDPLKDINLQDEHEYLASSEYKSLVSNHFSMKIYKDTTDTYEEVFKKHIVALPSGNIKNQLLYSDMRYMMGPNENLESFFSFFKENSTNAEQLQKIEEQYIDLQKLKKGELSPKFNYKNFAGGNTSLDDLAGKYVYVDVWATWCGPCKAEIPHLKEIEKNYHDKNIEFVSISVDKIDDEDKWRKMIEDKDLGGSQLFSDNSWDSKFVKDYRINGIPRFILIDPEGNIISADAPRPSEDKLIEKFDELSI